MKLFLNIISFFKKYLPFLCEQKKEKDYDSERI